MLRIHLRFHTPPVSGAHFRRFNGPSHASVSKVSFSVQQFFEGIWAKKKFCRERKISRERKIVISCNASRDSYRRIENWDDEDNEYIEASVLTSETIRHYQLHKQGFSEMTPWHSSSRLLPSSASKEDQVNLVSSVGHGFLSRFHSPTIFLKIACDGDILLPIIVGESAVKNLLGALLQDEKVDWPGQFQFVKNLINTLGYEVRMVRITKRVVNTYHALIYLDKPGDKAMISVDARPSDAINLAVKSQAPLYVNKQIVSTDAIRVVYGKWRENNVRSVYDVTLDSAPEGPDPLAEELDLLTKMNIAVLEERYKDAALWRDELSKLRLPRSEV
ncbi:hypothetical protein AMTRI_Chr09g34840 [Amborella trichopoda]